MVYISGEEMTRYTMELIMDKWINPFVDTSSWKEYNLSCVNRDATGDKVLHDAVDAGKELGAIFKEPTVTPSAVQCEQMGLSAPLCSPNGAMRKGWNGITISRDTIHIEGMQLGYTNPVLFERHAVGGEYGASFMNVGAGVVKSVFEPADGSKEIHFEDRKLTDDENAVVLYHNPIDNVSDLGRHFFARCLEANVTPYVVTKKTVFKWQEGFWLKMKGVFDAEFKTDFVNAGLLDKTDGDLQHLISDAATMQIIRWTDGGFGMAAHNYDGDMLTDEIAQVHRSPGFITSNLIGKNEDGSMIKEYEASHGTVSDMDLARIRGEPTSLNPLGMVEALIGAIQHACDLNGKENNAELITFTNNIRALMHRAMVSGHGTQDLCGPTGLTTEGFVDHIADGLANITEDGQIEVEVKQKPHLRKKVDHEAMREMFTQLDVEGNGAIGYEEFSAGLQRLGIQPRITNPDKTADV